MDTTQHVLAVLAGISVIGVGTQWLAWRIRIPAILLLLTAGCIAGPVTGFIDPGRVFGDLLLPIVSLSVGVILFEGGLNLRFRELHDTWRSLLGLLIVGVLVTWVGATMGGLWILKLPVSVALVLGAVLTVTGPTVIGPLLRDIRPTGRVGVIAKWEGIMIDPIGATLAVLVFEATASIQRAEFASATSSALVGLTMVIIVGLVVGLVAAAVLVLMIRQFWIPDYLQNPMTLMFVVAAFAAAELLHHEAGLLATTVMGIALANQRQIDMHRTIEFKESLTVLLISMLFILLSARVPLESLTSLGWRGPAFALFLIVVVRPVAVWLSTIGSGLSMSERAFLSWLAPRGIVAAAVSSVFALRLGEAGAAVAPATFIVIFSTVAIYGLTASRLARQLGLSTADAQGLIVAGANLGARTIAEALTKQEFDVVLVDLRYSQIRRARDAGLPACFANILSEHVLDEVDLGDVGQFLAMTPNDEINTLAVARFREMFGREKTFQLAMEESPHSRLDTEWQDRLLGRTLFSEKLTYDYIDRAVRNGASIKVTRLTETFDFAAFQSHYGSLAWPLFVIDGRKLHVLAADSDPAFRPGQSIVSLLETSASHAQTIRENESAEEEEHSNPLVAVRDLEQDDA